MITDQDRDDIRAFHLRMISNMPRRTFEQMRFSFCHRMELRSEWSATYCMAILTGITVIWYDCCIHSCVCYTGRLATLLKCPHCQENRFDEYGNPRHHFGYIPLIPRLQGFFQSKKQIELMSYRSNYEPSNDSISDVFDSVGYRVASKEGCD